MDKFVRLFRFSLKKQLTQTLRRVAAISNDSLLYIVYVEEDATNTGVIGIRI